MTFKTICSDFAKELASVNGPNDAALITAVVSVASKYERLALAYASRAGAVNDWDGRVIQSVAAATVAWFSFACDYFLLNVAKGQSVLGELRYRDGTKDAPLPEWHNQFDKQFRTWTSEEIKRVLETEDQWELVRSLLALRWFLRMRSSLVSVGQLGFPGETNPARETSAAWDYLTSAVLDAANNDYRKRILAVIAWGRGFGECDVRNGRVFVPPRGALPPRVALAIESGLFPFGIASRRGEDVWPWLSKRLSSSSTSDDKSAEFEWPYVAPPLHLPARLNAAAVTAKWHSDATRRDLAKRVLIECDRYGWHEEADKWELRASPVSNNHIMPSTASVTNSPSPNESGEQEANENDDDITALLEKIKTYFATRTIRDPKSGSTRKVFNLVMFGFSRTGKTTLLGNLISEWLPTGWPPNWDGLELNSEWRTWSKGSDAERQTEKPMQVTVEFDPNSEAGVVRCLDLPGEWYDPSLTSQSAGSERIETEFVKSVLPLAHAVLVVRPLLSEQLTEQQEALGQFVQGWAQAQTGRAFSPALFYCINHADEVMGWRPGVTLLVDSRRTRIENDLHVTDLLGADTDQRTDRWLDSCGLGDEVTRRVSRALDEVGGHGRLTAANGGFAVALLGGLNNERLRNWGNRHRLYGSGEVASAIREVLQKRGSLLDAEWRRASWASAPDSTLSFRGAAGAVRAFGRGIWDLAAHRIEEI